MKALKVTSVIILVCMCVTSFVYAQGETTEYTVGADDILEIMVSRPEEIRSVVTVAPDGAISFPYIGVINVDGKTLNEIQSLIVEKLEDGFMKYPVVTVSLQQSLSRKFFVYGEVVKPGNFLMDERTTVLKAISIAGGFTKFGSSSKVKVLREKEDSVGYETIKVNIKNVMGGATDEDILLEPGDIIVVSEGVF